MTCSACGKPLEPAWKFCGHCAAPTELGTALAAGDVTALLAHYGVTRSSNRPAAPPADPAKAKLVSALERVVSALLALERRSQGFFEASDFLAMYRDRLAEHVVRDDRVDFVAPILLEVGASSEPAGEGATNVRPRGTPCMGLALTLQDRVLFVWVQGSFRFQMSAAIVPYAVVKEVNDVVFRFKGEDVEGLEVIAGNRWPVLFPIAADAPDMTFWRTVLRDRLRGTQEPLWEGDHVTRWVAPAQLEAEGFRTASGRWIDTGPLQGKLEEDEQIEAVVGGGLVEGLGAEHDGILALTNRRVISFSADPERCEARPVEEIRRANSGHLSAWMPKADDDLVDLMLIDSLRNAARAEGIDATDLVFLGFHEEKPWGCTSTIRAAAEGVAFVEAVQRVHGAARRARERTGPE